MNVIVRLLLKLFSNKHAFRLVPVFERILKFEWRKHPCFKFLVPFQTHIINMQRNHSDQLVWIMSWVCVVQTTVHARLSTSQFLQCLGEWIVPGQWCICQPVNRFSARQDSRFHSRNAIRWLFDKNTTVCLLKLSPRKKAPSTSQICNNHLLKKYIAKLWHNLHYSA